MDVETCELRLIEAAWTLQCLPDSEARYRNGFKCLFPESTLDYNEIKNRHIPSPHDISIYEATLNWLHTIPPIRERKFMFCALLAQNGEKGYHIPWRKVRGMAGVSWSNWSCKELYRSWLNTMASRQNSSAQTNL